MKPFDLEAAKRGEPIVTGLGNPVKFIAHIPEADAPYRLVCYREGSGSTTDYYEDGTFTTNITNTNNDLFMAPKKKTVWINIYDGICKSAYYYESEQEADVQAGNTGNRRVGKKAWPLEIEE